MLFRTCVETLKAPARSYVLKKDVFWLTVYCRTSVSAKLISTVRFTGNVGSTMVQGNSTPIRVIFGHFNSIVYTFFKTEQLKKEILLFILFRLIYQWHKKCCREKRRRWSKLVLQIFRWSGRLFENWKKTAMNYSRKSSFHCRRNPQWHSHYQLTKKYSANSLNYIQLVSKCGCSLK